MDGVDVRDAMTRRFVFGVDGQPQVNRLSRESTAVSIGVALTEQGADTIRFHGIRCLGENGQQRGHYQRPLKDYKFRHGRLKLPLNHQLPNPHVTREVHDDELGVIGLTDTPIAHSAFWG